MTAQGEPKPRDRHTADDAGLYVLGMLEPLERAHFEAHIANCDACFAAAAAAAETIAVLDEAFVEDHVPPEQLGRRISASARALPAAAAPVRHERRIPWRPAREWAVAASFAVAAFTGGGAFFEHASDARVAAQDSAVLGTLARSHFRHVTLDRRTPGAPAVKVMYAQDGGWMYVVIDRGIVACHIVTTTANGTHNLGAPLVRGSAATLYTETAAHPNAVQVVDNSGTVLAESALPYR